MPQNQTLPIASDPSALATILAPYRAAGEKIALVPTMGALHEGHLSLVEAAKDEADRVVATIFVNPKQFGPNEDLATYPRTLEQDVEKLQSAGATAAYVPTPDVMYPEGYATTVSVEKVSEPLDGATRAPGYFAGIATVVLKLFLQTRPDVAIFGEKDYQQLLVIKRMAEDLDTGVRVIGAPIIREADGLAMSSRNRYLSAEERPIAGQLNLIMLSVVRALRDGVPPSEALRTAETKLHAAGLHPVHYFELRQEPLLTEVPLDRPLPHGDWEKTRLFAAVMLGRTRLIDNMSLSPDGA